jgi:hypothetical protein
MHRIMLGLLAACGDSTNIAGDYLGNLTFTASITAPAATTLVGAAAATVVIDDADDSGARMAIGDGCVLDTFVSKQSVIDDHSGTNRFVFTAENVSDDMATCTLAVTGGALTFTVAQGDFVVDAGLTMMLQLGGSLAAAPDGATAGYVAIGFGGAQ